MLDVLNRYAHGFIVVPTVLASRRGGLLSALQSGPVKVEQLCRDLGANSGHLEVTLRLFHSLGWIDSHEPGVYEPRPELERQRLIPDDIAPLLHADMEDYLRNGDGGLLAPFIDRSRERWGIEDEMLADFCDSLLVVPVLALLAKRNALDDIVAEGFTVLPEGVRQEVVDLLRSLRWLDGNAGAYRLTPPGEFMFERAMNLGVAESYRPLLIALEELLFGDTHSVFGGYEHGDYIDRELNVVASEFVHDSYFGLIEETVLSIFSREPLSEQPKVVVDMGCGEGTFLKRVYEIVCDKTPRGQRLDQYPLLLVGVDHDQASLDETRRNLHGTGCEVLAGDLNDPRQVIDDIASLGVDPDSILHIRSFLEHTRTNVPPIDSVAVEARESARYAGVYVDRNGRAIPPASAVQSLVEHYQRWRDVITDHGLVSLDVHCQEPLAVRTYIDMSESLHYDALQGYSNQLLVTADVSLMAAAEAGLFPDRGCFRRYPGEFSYSRISLNHFERRPYRVRMARPSDLPALLQLEEACWPAMCSSGDELLRRIRDYPPGQWVLVLDENVVGAIYSQRVANIEALRDAKVSNIGALLDWDGSVVQFLSLNVFPEFQHLGLGDQLLDLMLMRSALQSGVEQVAGLTRCSSFRGSSIEEYEAYLAARDSSDRPVDPILRFHHNHGAAFFGFVPGYRPEDKNNLGAGVLFRYDFSKAGTGLQAPKPAGATLNIDPDADVSDRLEACLRFVLGPSKQDAFSRNRPLRDMGVDSLGLLEFRTLLEQTFEQQLSPTFFFSHTTLSDIGRYFESPRVRSPAPGHRDAQPVDLRDSMEEDNIRIDPGYPASQRQEGIAIVGMAGRFPGSPDLHSYWTLLAAGKESISEVPLSRWDNDAYYDEDPHAPGKIVSRYGGFLGAVDEFDASFFEISPNEARLMDPQQRLLMEIYWEAIEHAGIDAARLKGKNCGIFVGLYSHDYELLQASQGKEDDLGAFCATGNSASIAAGRIAYFLGTRGPALTIDTACSSSLVAVHQAMQWLRSGQGDLAMASGVNLMLSPRFSIMFSQAGMLAPDGHCKTFDAAADGYVRSEGCAALVLKRLRDAHRDGDRILGVLRGSYVNQDGASNGLTAPSLVAQEELLRGALEDAGLEPSEIDYVEAHGTGTNLGDPVEFAALNAVFGNDAERADALWLGSAKTNIGHAEAAAGIAGLIKVVLAMRHQTMPAHLNFSDPNPLIDLDGLPARIPLEATPWSSVDRPLRSGVSSFGFSGTNAHVIVEQVPELPGGGAQDTRHSHLLTVSAKSSDALQTAVGRYVDWFADHEECDLSNVCYTASAGRAHHRFRMAAIGSTPRDMAAALSDGSNRQPGRRAADRSARVAFLFTGQGSQYLNMARGLALTEPCFRTNMRRCQEILESELAWSLEELLYADPDADIDDSGQLNDTAITQPVLFAVEYALARTLQSWGIRPCAVMGHSVGEYVAACLAGVFSLEDGVKLIAARGRLMASLPPGGSMCAVLGKDPDLLDQLLADRELSIAAYNGPENVVISGSEHEIAAITRPLEDAGLKTVPLPVSHAFHSALMDPILPEFREVANLATFSEPGMKLVSNVTGGFEKAAVADPEYWVSHIRQPVNFERGIRTLLANDIDIMVEVGPHPVLTYMGQAIQAGNPADDAVSQVAWTGTLNREMSDRDSILCALKSLYEVGVDIDWAAFHSGHRRSVTDIPGYPWQRRSFWFHRSDAVKSGTAVATNGSDENTPLLYLPSWVARSRGDYELAGSGDAKWVILSDQSGVGEKLAAALAMDGVAHELIYRTGSADVSGLSVSSRSELESLLADYSAGETQAMVHLLYLWPLDEIGDIRSGEQMLEAVACSGLQLVDIVRAAAENDVDSLTIVTSGCRQVDSADRIELAQSSLTGLGNVVQVEYPNLDVRQVDLDPSDDVHKKSRCLLRELEPSGNDPRTAYRSGQRYVQSLSPLDAQGGRFGCSAAGNYLIVGGMGDLGLHTAHFLARHGARNFVLAGRTDFPNAQCWDELADDEKFGPKIRLVREIQESGAHLDFRVLDVNDAAAVKNLVTDICRSKPLLGVVHTVAVLSDHLIADVAPEDYRNALSPKVAGALNVLTAVADQPLEFCAFYSSIGSLVGLPGQASYAASNAFLDALCARERARGKPVFSINWCGWDDAGLTKTGGGKRVLDELALLGIGSLAADRAIAQFADVVASNRAQAAVIPLISMSSTTDSGGDSDPLLRELRQRLDLSLQSIARPGDPGASGTELETLRDDELQPRITEIITGSIAELLHLEAQDIDLDCSLGDMGMTSLLGLEFRKIVQSRCGVVLSPMLVWNFPTVGAVISHIVQRASGTGGGGASGSARTEAANVRGGDVPRKTRMEELSDEDALYELIGKPQAN